MKGTPHFKYALMALAVSAGIGYQLETVEPPVEKPQAPQEAPSKRLSVPLDLSGEQPTIIPMESSKRDTTSTSIDLSDGQGAMPEPAEPTGPVLDPQFRTPKPVFQTMRGADVASARLQPDATTASPSLSSSDIETVSGVINTTVTKLTVKPGDTLSDLFRKAGHNDQVMYQVIHGEGDAGNIQKLYPGETLEFETTDSGTLVALSLQRNPLTSLMISKTDEGYHGSKEVRTPEVYERTGYGVIENSLYIAAKKAGLTDKTAMELADIFGWDVDFVYDIRKGDRFEVIYEELMLDGRVLGTGKILAARFVNRGDELVALYYPGADGDYYTPEGKSMRKAFLRAPINARVSSPFNLQRRHPVLNIVRPHEGIDYAAPVGTPIKAAGNGRVIFAGTKGGYGRTVILKHGRNITTLYAHMRGIAKGIRKGARVKQGDTVGYLGSTGMVTGPHLHYEFRVDGRPKNSRTVELPDAEPLPASKMAEFNALTREWRSTLDGVLVSSTRSED